VRGFKQANWVPASDYVKKMRAMRFTLRV